MAQLNFPSILLATWLLGTVAAKFNMDEFLQDLPSYEIVYPKILSTTSRDKRSTTDQTDEPLLIEISNWTIKTVTNQRVIISPHFTVEFVSSEQRTDPLAGTNCNLHQGSLDGVNSLVVLTICEETVYALMLVDEKSLVVQPLDDGRHLLYESKGLWHSGINEGMVSVMREGRKWNEKETERAGRMRRETTSFQTQEFYNLSSDTLDIDNLQSERLVLYEDKEDDQEDASDEEEVQVDQDNTGYFSDPTWSRNRLTKSSRWLELGIAADYTVIDFHGNRVQQYLLALLNIVSAIYMDPSLQSNMVLVIVRMVLYAEKRDGMVRRGDARKSLENVNKWNKKMLSHADVGHDVAVWLTRLDIGGPSGYAPVSGVCNPARSCALNRDEGLTSAFIIAHEIAHM